MTDIGFLQTLSMLVVGLKTNQALFVFKRKVASMLSGRYVERQYGRKEFLQALQDFFNREATWAHKQGGEYARDMDLLCMKLNKL